MVSGVGIGLRGTLRVRYLRTARYGGCLEY